MYTVSHAGLIELSPRGGVKRANVLGARLLGYESPASLIEAARKGAPLPVEIRRLVEEHLEEVRTGTPVDVIASLQRPDGGDIRCRLTLVGCARKDDATVVLVNAARGDPIPALDEILRFHQSHVAESLFRQLADAIPQIVWVASAQGEVEYLNRRWFELTGEEEGEKTPSLSFTEHIDVDDLAKVAETIEHSVATGDVFYAEIRFLARDGSYRWHLARAVPLYGEPDQLPKWLGTGTDIEEQKRTEDALREEQRRKDEFLATLGHELRNPLTPIRNAVTLLENPGLPPSEQDRAKAIIQRQVGHMARLVDDLLDVARIITGNVVLRREDLDLVQLLRACIDDHRDAFQRRGLRLESRIPESIPCMVNVDAARISQMVGNLLDNAQKYTHPGDVTSVELTKRPDRGLAVLCVRDTGIGMSQEALRKIFVPFSHLGRKVGQAGETGLGLGLSLVKGLVELHGGSVEVKSDGLGCGTEFVVELPLASEQAVAASGPSPSAPLSTGQSILIIEDNEDAAESLRMLLAMEGHVVAVAGNAEDGILQARRVRPDVILSDIGLPGKLNGYDVARVLRQEMPETRLIAVSGYGQEQDLKVALAAGFEQQLTKPFDEQDLMGLLARPALQQTPRSTAPGPQDELGYRRPRRG